MKHKKVNCSKHEKAGINYKAITYGVAGTDGESSKTCRQKAERFLSIASAPENICDIRV